MSETMLYKKLNTVETDITISMEIQNGEATVLFSTSEVTVQGLTTDDLEEACAFANSIERHLLGDGELPIHDGEMHIGTLLVTDPHIHLITPLCPWLTERFEIMNDAFIKLQEHNLYIK